MSNASGAGKLARASNGAVRRQTRTLFLAAVLLLLVNVALGFANALTTGAVPRWQVLVHLHSGTLGWITLGVIGFAIWLFTGDREVTPTYARRVQLLGWLAILTFVGLVASFGIAFSQGGDATLLLPVFGTGAALTIWAAAIFALTQLRRQPVVTTVHVLVAGGLLVAAAGVTMGVVLGLENAVGSILPFEYSTGLSGHQGPMDWYLLLVAAGLVEWLVTEDGGSRRTRSGTVQAGLGVLLGLLLPVVLLLVAFGLPESAVAVAILFVPGFVVYALLLLARVGLRALRTNPFDGGTDAWAFFGTLGLVGYVVLWPLRLALGDPGWWLVVFYHVMFVGMMTNLLLGVLSARTRASRHHHAWAEPVAQWLLNGGLVLFVALKLTVDVRHGALVMGAGVLLGVVVMLLRLLKRPGEGVSREQFEDGAV